MDSVLSNSPWWQRNLKKVQNEITKKRFLVGNTKINISTNQGYHFGSEVLQNNPKLGECCSWN